MLTLPVAGKPHELSMIPFIVEKKSSTPSKATSSQEKKEKEPGSSLVEGETEVAAEGSSKQPEAPDKPLELEEVELKEKETKEPAGLSQLRDLQGQLRDLIRTRGKPAKKMGEETRAEIAELLLKIQKTQEQQCLQSTGLQKGEGA
jgi:hypothetical protein